MTVATFRQFWGNEKKEHKYSSIMAELPEYLCDEIISWGFDHIPNEYLIDNPENPTFGREDDCHITLLNGMEFDDPRNVESCFHDEKSFKCKLGEMHLFTRSDLFDVLVIHVESNNLHRLNAKLRKYIITKEQHIDFIPHVTIAFLKKGKGEEFIKNKTFQGLTFDVNEFVFSTKLHQKTIIPLGET